MPVVGGFGCGELQHAVGEDVEVVAVAVGQHDDDGAGYRDGGVAADSGKKNTIVKKDTCEEAA